MSTWTHVAGCIRVDSFPFLPQPDFKKIFIKELWDEKDDGECNMPSGSEGSLDYRIIRNPNPDAMSAYTVLIFGDLRDFGKEDKDEITQWWNRVLKQCGMIRQAILQVIFEDSEEPLILQSGVKYE